MTLTTEGREQDKRYVALEPVRLYDADNDRLTGITWQPADPKLSTVYVVRKGD
jgi:hypothetical protein